MHRPTRTASAALASLLIAAALSVSPAPVVARAPLLAAPRTATADLAPALLADGTFQGVPGVSGTVDAKAWNMTSSLTTGAAPRFAPATTATAAPSAATPAGTWAAFGSDGAGNGAVTNIVNAIAIIGTDLYIGGNFTNLAGIPEADYVAKWNGSAWSALGSNGAGNGALGLFVNALAVDGNDLYVGGDFLNAGGIPEADMVAKWSGGVWSALGSNGAGDGAFDVIAYVTALAVYKGDLYANASFYVKVLGGGTWSGLVRWTNGSWTDVGGWQYGANALVVAGGLLYVASGGVSTWDGGTWAPVGTGSMDVMGGQVWAIAVSGSTVYAGGTFRNAGGVAEADYIAKWNGSAWSALGSNGVGVGPLGNYVNAIAVSGTDVYVGGQFYVVGGNTLANGIAKWDGSAWSALGSNGAGGAALASGYSKTLLVSGTDLIVGGAFANAGGVPEADYIAAWGMVPSAPPAHKADGRIRVGTTGAFTGNDVYNATAASQSVTGSALRGHTVTFGISIQNDGTAADRFKVRATGTATTRYTVKYYRGATNITAAVVAGTYKTPVLAAGAAFLITAKVTVKSTATVGSSVARKVTITSVASAALKDAVKFTVKRK